MAKQSSVNLDITNNVDGFDISGGTTPRTLSVTGGSITLAGSGSAVVTFPTTSTTIAGLGITQTFTALQSFSAGISAAGATFSGNISAPNIVTSFNGATGAVTGASLGANTFTALNTFNAGISAAGGVTFANDISVNDLRIGQGPVSGYSNTAIGYDTLTLLESGTSNTAIGTSALASATAGSSNVAIGTAAMGSGSNAGSGNVAIGDSALWQNNGGVGNIAIGSVALEYNESGSSNVAIGDSSLSGSSNTANSNNTAIGNFSLGNISTGSQNTAIGSLAGRRRGSGASSLTSATGGIYIGYDARGSANAQTNEIVIGTLAVGLGSNTAVIGATAQTSATIYGLLRLPSGLSASGATLSSNTTIPSGATLTVNGNFVANGNVNLGDAVTDAITVTGVLAANGGLSAAGGTFSGNISAPNIVTSFNGVTGAVTGVSRVNGLSGGITLAAGTGITFTASGNTITLAATASGGSNSTTQTLDFSEDINGVEIVFYGTGGDLGTSLQNVENNKIITATIGSDGTNFNCVLDSIKSFYDPSNGWSARLIAKAPFTAVHNPNDIRTIENIRENGINEVALELTTASGLITNDYWITLQSHTVYHQEATYVVKTVTGQSWVTAGSYIECKVLGLTTDDHTPEDAILEGVQFEINNIVVGTGFDIIGHAPEGTYGKYSVKCLGQ
jgi:hypothetical protein